MKYGPNAQLALKTLRREETAGIPTWLVHVMQIAHIERLAGARPGGYREDPEGVYIQAQRNIGCCILDQFVPENPLTMGEEGYGHDAERSATTGAERIVLDGVTIDSPEAVVEHMEKVSWPRMREAIEGFDEDARVEQVIRQEKETQHKLGPDILKTGFELVNFPCLRYYRYGYENYFMAYALFPEVMERDFALQADLALANNRAVARACREGNLAPLERLDFDMADGRGTLVSMDSLERIWFPHFARCLEPMLRTDVKMIWHCDGNLMQMLPRLLEVGLEGFQGFQYEFGMDYEAISRMKTRSGDEPILIAGVSVTRTLPSGSPQDVRDELRRLVEIGPKRGLFLGASSSVMPGTPWENIQALVEGLEFYRTNGRR